MDLTLIPPAIVSARTVSGSGNGILAEILGAQTAAAFRDSIVRIYIYYNIVHFVKIVRTETYANYSDGCGPVKSLQHGFCTGLNFISSTRTRSGSYRLRCPLPSVPD